MRFFSLCDIEIPADVVIIDMRYQQPVTAFSNARQSKFPLRICHREAHKGGILAAKNGDGGSCNRLGVKGIREFATNC